MPRKTLQQVAEDEMIHKLASIVEVIETEAGNQSGVDFAADPFGGMAIKEVWGVKEAKTQLPTLLREVSAGEIHFVTAGDGTPIMVVNAKNLVNAVATIEERKGLTLADAIRQLPYPPSAMKPVKLRRLRPARGLIHRTRVAEEA